jgi:hypothetical protein
MQNRNSLLLLPRSEGGYSNDSRQILERSCYGLNRYEHNHKSALIYGFRCDGTSIRRHAKTVPGPGDGHDGRGKLHLMTPDRRARFWLVLAGSSALATAIRY